MLFAFVSIVLGHSTAITREIVIQADASGAAAVLVTIDVPRAERAAMWRRTWDRDHNGVVDAREAAMGAREVAGLTLTDVVLEADRSEPSCQIDVRSRGIAGRTDDAPFAVAALVQCEPATFWSLYAGARVETTLRFSRPSSCSVHDERFASWTWCK